MFVILWFYFLFCLLCRKSQLVKSDNAFRQRSMFLIKNLKKYEFIEYFCYFSHKHIQCSTLSLVLVVCVKMAKLSSKTAADIRLAYTYHASFLWRPLCYLHWVSRKSHAVQCHLDSYIHEYLFIYQSSE